MDTSFPPNMRSSFTSDKAKLSSVINQLSFQHTPSRLKTALSIARNYQTPNTKIYVISDDFGGLLDFNGQVEVISSIDLEKKYIAND